MKNTSKSIPGRREILKLLAGGTAAAILPASLKAKSRSSKLPNVVFILIDDLGWSDIGCFGSDFHDTPNIDRLASDGMKFTDGYAACPVCSPTRASIMTGKYPARLQLTDFLKGRRSRVDSPILPAEYADYLPLEEVTIAEALKQVGYTTCHVGKWHLGHLPYYPENQGFDYNIAGSYSGMPRSFFWPEWRGNPPITGRFEGEYLPDRMSDEAVKFIEGHKDKPFFLYLAHYSVHIPIEAKEELIRKYNFKKKGKQNNPIYAAMVESIDQSVGKVMGKLKELGIDDNTAVFFMSDNGGLAVEEGRHTPATTNAPLRAGKGYLYEGGIREPWIVKWPGMVKPGSVCTEPVSSVDFFPTICEMAGSGMKSYRDIDGVSIVPLLKQAGGLDREAIYWHYPHFSNQGGKPGGAVRKGDFKLIERYEDGALELFNLREDISEMNNIAQERPDKVNELHSLLIEWRKSVNANMPRPNPNYVK